jgi:hypothetical protein
MTVTVDCPEMTGIVKDIKLAPAIGASITTGHEPGPPVITYDVTIGLDKRAGIHCTVIPLALALAVTFLTESALLNTTGLRPGSVPGVMTRFIYPGCCASAMTALNAITTKKIASISKRLFEITNFNLSVMDYRSREMSTREEVHYVHPISESHANLSEEIL